MIVFAVYTTSKIMNNKKTRRSTTLCLVEISTIQFFDDVTDGQHFVSRYGLISPFAVSGHWGNSMVNGEGCLPNFENLTLEMNLAAIN